MDSKVKRFVSVKVLRQPVVATTAMYPCFTSCLQAPWRTTLAQW